MHKTCHHLYLKVSLKKKIVFVNLHINAFQMYYLYKNTETNKTKQDSLEAPIRLLTTQREREISSVKHRTLKTQPQNH